VSRSTLLDFWDESLNSNTGGWNSLAVSELVDVVYDDEVYKPASISIQIQNRSAGGGLAYTNIPHSSASPTVVTNNAHGLETNDRITVTSESSGELELKIYGVEKIDVNTFYLKHYHEDPRTGLAHLGGESERVDGDGSSSPTLNYTSTGKYSVQTAEVYDPDFYLGQEVMLWHFPNGFTKTDTYSHNGSVHALNITYPSHPFSNGEIVQVVDEDTGAVSDDSYMIKNETTNAFNLNKVKNGSTIVGNGNAGNLAFYFKNKSAGFPLFFGAITDVQESWSPGYGKIIVIKAVDRLQFLNNTTAKAFIKDIASSGETIGGTPRSGASIPRLSYLTGQVGDSSGNRFSTALATIVDDFAEGANIIHTDNTVNGSTAFTSDAEKFEASGFVLTANELASGNFIKDVSESNHKVLRVMQQLAMQDRHYTSSGSGTGAAYGSGSSVTITDSAHGLSLNDIIYVHSDNNASPPPAHIPSGLYRVGGTVTTNSFGLYTLDKEVVANSLGTGTVSWEGMADGNFGYDFYLDSGMYGVPTSTGYSIAGNSTEYAARPHLNYFKRGYRQFRPDATSLNMTLPVENDTVETGQVRIMYPDANFRVGEDEIISSVELSSDIATVGSNDAQSSVGLGHTLEAMRISKIACKDNVMHESTAVGKALYTGEWLGDFHWGRHDSVVRRTGNQLLVGRNDYSMFWETGGSRTTSPLIGTDDGDTWVKSSLTLGTTQRRLSNARVIVSGAGGYQNTRGSGLGSHQERAANSGLAGLSELPQAGRPLHLSPISPSYQPKGFKNPFSGTKEDPDVNEATTGICDSDLIKSIRNTQNEGLYANDPFVHGGITNTNDTPALKVTTVNDHGLQTGALILVTGGTVDANYWNNYYRVEYIAAKTFYVTRPAAELFEGISSPPATQDIYASGSRIAYTGSSQITDYKIVYNVFNGVCRVQYQTLNGRTEKSFTENLLLISDRIKKDKPYAAVEVDAVEGRESSNTTLAGLPTGIAVMPDSTLYGATLTHINRANPVPVRFRKGDRISETRYLTRDSDVAGTARLLFKNTQAVLVQSLLGDKNQSKTEQLSYSFKGNDLDEVRRTAAAMLARSSRDLIRGNLSIVEYPFIKLTGATAGGSTGAILTHSLTTSVGLYGGRPGMLVHKTDTNDGNFVAGVLAEDVTTTTVTGTLSDGETWSTSQFYRMYVHLRAGHSVRVTDPRSSISSNMIVTKITYTEGPDHSQTRMEVIGFKDTATGFAVKPLGQINANAQRSSKKQPTNPFRAGKASLNITIQAGTI
tara:strand:+ start:4450 stop:8268 length:3819 start_codon:yes stop_codon:yes gene_type:complete